MHNSFSRFDFQFWSQISDRPVWAQLLAAVLKPNLQCQFAIRYHGVVTVVLMSQQMKTYHYKMNHSNQKMFGTSYSLNRTEKNRSTYRNRLCSVGRVNMTTLRNCLVIRRLKRLWSGNYSKNKRYEILSAWQWYSTFEQVQVGLLNRKHSNIQITIIQNTTKRFRFHSRRFTMWM